MELVDGCHITEFCNAQQIGLRETLKVLISVCDAVQHAHHRGIIHRDLKPSNVLVETVDGKPFVKVIDFGIQEAIGTHASQRHISPSPGGAAGTLLYMSPEQAGLKQQTLDTRTDVYSIGVLLYELLTGETPFSGQAAEIDAKKLRRLICETDPMLLSKRIKALRRITSSKSAAFFSTMASLSSVARKELDWITAKALKRQPEQRYQSPGALASDLQRFLDGDVVLAVPASTRYRTYKTILKHRWSVLLFACVFLSLLVGMLVSLQQAQLARSAQRMADKYLAESIAEQSRYRNLAWESIIRRAYTAAYEGRLCDTSSLLNELAASDPEARERPEWQLLQHEIENSFRKLLTVEKPLHEIRVVGRSKQIVAVGEDGRIRVVNTDSGKLERIIETEIRALHALAISSCGRLVAVGGVTDPSPDLARVLVFDLTTGVLVAELPAQITTIESLEFSSDGSLLACGTRYEPVQVHEISSGKILATLPAERRNRWLSASPDGRQLVALHATKSIWLCDFQTPFTGRSLAVPWTVIGAIWEPVSGRLVCFLKGDHGIVAFDPVGQCSLAEFRGTADAVCLALSYDGKELFAGLESGELISWPMPTLAGVSQRSQNESQNTADSTTASRPATPPSGRWKLSNAPLTSVSVSDTAVFASTFSGELLSFQTPAIQATLNNEGLQISAVAWNSNGSTLVAASLDGAVQQSTSHPERWRRPDGIAGTGTSTTGENAWKFLTTAQEYPVTALAISDDGKSTAWARQGDEAIVIQEHGITERELPHEVQTGSDHDVSLKAIAFSPTSESIAWTGDRHLRWTLLSDEAKPIHEVLLPGRGRCLAWSPDGTALFVGGNFSELIRVAAESGDARTLENTGTETTAIRLRPDGRQVVSGHSDGALRFHSLADDRITTAHIHQGAVSSICLSQDGRLGVSCDSNGRLALWFAQSGELIGFLRAGDLSDVNDLQFSAQLAFAGNDQHLRAAFVSATRELQIRSWELGARLRP